MIVFIQGGLGNQMFQYAFAKAMQQRYGIKVKLYARGYENASIDSNITESSTKDNLQNPEHIRNLELKSFNISLDFIDNDKINSFYVKYDKFFAFCTMWNKHRICKILLSLIPKKYRRNEYKYHIKEHISSDNKIIESLFGINSRSAINATDTGGGGAK